MAQTITLKNRRRAPIVMNLPSAVVPEMATMGGVARIDHDATPVSGPKDTSAPGAGARSGVIERRAISGSITLLARGNPEGADVARGLPRSVLQAPDVIKRTRGRDPDVAVEVVDVGEPAKDAAPDQAPPPEPAPAPTATPTARTAPARRAAKETE